MAYDIAGRIKDGKKCMTVLIGGPFRGCIAEAHLDIHVDYEFMVQFGTKMSSGGFVVMDENICMVGVAKFFMDFIKLENCRKCILYGESTYR
jgi:NADH:ubiquinone oxidoreductase subunit F (NADH-binding)